MCEGVASARQSGELDCVGPTREEVVGCGHHTAVLEATMGGLLLQNPIFLSPTVSQSLNVSDKAINR